MRLVTPYTSCQQAILPLLLLGFPHRNWHVLSRVYFKITLVIYLNKKIQSTQALDCIIAII